MSPKTDAPDRLTGHQTPPKVPTRESAIDAAYSGVWDTIRDALVAAAKTLKEAGATRTEANDILTDIVGDCRAEALGGFRFHGE